LGCQYWTSLLRLLQQSFARLVVLLLLQQIGFVASFTSKLSDTVSSEVGKVRYLTTAAVSNRQVTAVHLFPT
jgi:uncharacterized membrane protein